MATYQSNHTATTDDNFKSVILLNDPEVSERIAQRTCKYLLLNDCETNTQVVGWGVTEKLTQTFAPMRTGCQSRSSTFAVRNVITLTTHYYFEFVHRKTRVYVMVVIPVREKLSAPSATGITRKFGTKEDGTVMVSLEGELS